MKEVDSVPRNKLSNSLNNKLKLVIDFRKRGDVYVPVIITDTKVEMVKCFKLFSVNITNNLSWTNHMKATAKKAYDASNFSED